MLMILHFYQFLNEDTQRLMLLVCWFETLAVCSVAERAMAGAAARRRLRYLRSMWRHEQLSVNMMPASISHHSWESRESVGVQTDAASTEFFAPAAATAAPTPVTVNVVPAPTVMFDESAPVIEYLAPAPAFSSAAPAPVTEYVTPAPAHTYTAPSPVTDDVPLGNSSLSGLRSKS